MTMTTCHSNDILAPHQLDAVKRMKKGCILNGGVGSGKSRTSLAFYYIQQGGKLEPKLTKMKNPHDLYIITTAGKRDKHEWEDELDLFRIGSDSYPNKVVIDSWNNIKKYKDVKDGFFIFDEQRVVGKGEWVKSFIAISKRNFWILLSATPGDTWSDYIPVFIANGFYKNRTQFNSEHVVFARFVKYPKIERYLGERKLQRLRDEILIDMDFMRDTVQHHENIPVEYDILKYRECQKFRFNYEKNKPFKTASELVYALRKIVNSDESRILKVLEIFEKKHKVIIFYNFDYELEMLKGAYYGDNVVIAEWNGHKHEPVPKSDSWVYLVQYSAGAEGWNCTDTDTIIFYSQNYSYKTVVQASGRTDRLTTPYKDLWYYHLKSSAPIDRGISRALKQKKNFNERSFVKS